MMKCYQPDTAWKLFYICLAMCLALAVPNVAEDVGLLGQIQRIKARLDALELQIDNLAPDEYCRTDALDVHNLEAAVVKRKRHAHLVDADIVSASVGYPYHRLIAYSRRSWHSVLAFKLAVQLESKPTAAYICDELRQGDAHARHFLAADMSGKLYVFSMTGRLLLEHTPDGASPITAIQQMKNRPNSTHVATGHANGCIRMHTMVEDLARASEGAVPVDSIDEVAHSSYCPVPGGGAAGAASIKGLYMGRTADTLKRPSVVGLTADNMLVMMRDRGRPPTRVPIKQTVLHMWHAHKQVRMITDSGMAVVSLHPTNTSSVRYLPCKGLNGTALVHGAHDPAAATRAYALSAGGDLIQLHLIGDKKVTSCRVRSRQEAGYGGAATNIALVRGALFASNHSSISVYDTSGPFRRGPAWLLSERLSALPRYFGASAAVRGEGAPVLATTASGATLVEVGGGVLALYEMPVKAAAEPNDVAWLKWSRPLMLIVMGLVAAWQFYRSKSRAAVGHGAVAFGASGDNERDAFRQRLMQKAMMSKYRTE